MEEKYEDPALQIGRNRSYGDDSDDRMCSNEQRSGQHEQGTGATQSASAAGKSNVNVESEFATLKRVVLSQSEFFLPAQGMEQAASENNAGNTQSAGVFPEFGNLTAEESQKAWETERVNFKKVLEKYGVEIQRPRLLTQNEKELATVKDGVTGGTGATNFFVRDPFFTIGNHMIEASFRSPWRRLEVLTVRDIMNKEIAKNKSPYVAVPQPDISKGFESETGPFLEGGDVLGTAKRYLSAT